MSCYIYPTSVYFGAFNVLEFLLDDSGSLVPPLERVPTTAVPKPSTREEIFACANTAKLLQELGDDVEVTEEDATRARRIFEEGREPNTYEKQLPGVMLHLEALLTQYDYSLLEDANTIRNYVTNKLIEETECPDPRVRLKAYELLGKITEVGLFTERVEASITVKPSTELEALIREKLQRLTGRVIEHEERQEVDDPALLRALEAAETVDAEDII